MKKPDRSQIMRAKRRKQKRDRRAKRCARPSYKRRKRFKWATTHLSGQAFSSFVSRLQAQGA